MPKIPDWIISLLKNPLVRAYGLAILRHCLTAAGVLVVSKGYLDNSHVQEYIGSVMTVASVLLSQYDVKQVDNKVNAAIALAPQSAPEVIQALKNGKF